MATTSEMTTFGVACPRCHEDGAAVRMDLNSLGDCVCLACDEEFTVREAIEDATGRLRAWQAVARWVAMAPSAQEGD